MLPVLIQKNLATRSLGKCHLHVHTTAFNVTVALFFSVLISRPTALEFVAPAFWQMLDLHPQKFYTAGRGMSPHSKLSS